MALKKLDWSLGEKNVKCTDQDDNEVAKFLKIERERNERQEEVIEVEMCKEFEKNEIERKKYDEQRYCEYITEEDGCCNRLKKLNIRVPRETSRMTPLKHYLSGVPLLSPKSSLTMNLTKSRLLKNENRYMKRKCAFSI